VLDDPDALVRWAQAARAAAQAAAKPKQRHQKKR
jgi:hypothetical protein